MTCGICCQIIIRRAVVKLLSRVIMNVISSHRPSSKGLNMRLQAILYVPSSHARLVKKTEMIVIFLLVVKFFEQ